MNSVTRLDNRGRLVIPNEMRDMLNLKEGDEILIYSYTPKNTLSRLKVDIYVPAVYTNVATNAVLSLFQDSTCIGASGIRLPNTGASSGHQIHATAIVNVTSKTAITFSARMGPKAATGSPQITVGDRFNGLSDPFIVLQEM